MKRNYSKYINDFCEEYCMSGAQLARMMGVSEETIQSIRRGSRKPQQATKDRLNRFILKYKKENEPKNVTQIGEVQKEILGIDSRTVAEWIGKQHKELLRDIRQYAEYLKGADLRCTDFWQETTYKAENGKVNPCYIVTKKGCEFIQHKMTGQKGAVFTAKYIDYFWKQGEELQEATQLLLDLAEEPAGAETSTQALPTLEQAENNYIDTLAKAIQESSTRAEKVELIERLNKFVSGL